MEGCICVRSNTQAILLAAGNKSGVSEKRFYKRFVAKADKRFQAHLDRLQARKE